MEFGDVRYQQFACLRPMRTTHGARCSIVPCCTPYLANFCQLLVLTLEPLASPSVLHIIYECKQLILSHPFPRSRSCLNYSLLSFAGCGMPDLYNNFAGEPSRGFNKEKMELFRVGLSQVGLYNR